MTISEFSLKSYAQLLEAALVNDYSFLSFRDIGKESSEYTCLLRHDIDSELLNCNPMLAVERDLNVKATYFVMVRSTAYNLFCLEATEQIEKILLDGHQLGLHFMTEQCENDSDEVIFEKIERETFLLEREFGIKPSAISFHQPAQTILDRNLEFPGYCNTYNQNQTGDYFYISDTNMNWRYQHPLEIFNNRIYPRLQLLIHPMWWTNYPMDTKGKWLAVLNENRRVLISHWKKRERSLIDVDLV